MKFASSHASKTVIDAGVLSCTNTHSGDHGEIYWCDPCRLGFSPPPDQDELLKLYGAVEDPGYLSELAARRRHAHAILARVERWQKPGRLLEIGSQVGILLEVARERGWQAQGIEPSEWAVATGRSMFGVDLSVGSLETTDLPSGSFDLVVMVDVLEHLLDPLAGLERCHEWLVPGGMLALSTVNVGTSWAKLLGTRWPGFMDMHLTYFTQRSLREYMRRARFRWLRALPDTRWYSLGYIGARLEHSGRALRAIGKLSSMPGLRLVPVPLATRDLLLVIARAVD